MTQKHVNQDGVYYLVHYGYRKRVNANFRDNGTLCGLWDSDDNCYLDYAKQEGVENPLRTECYLENAFTCENSTCQTSWDLSGDSWHENGFCNSSVDSYISDPELESEAGITVETPRCPICELPVGLGE